MLDEMRVINAKKAITVRNIVVTVEAAGLDAPSLSTSRTPFTNTQLQLCRFMADTILRSSIQLWMARQNREMTDRQV